MTYLKFTLITFITHLFFTFPLIADDRAGGGGSFYKGIPLESYIQNPKKLEAYKQYIIPIMEKLSPKQKTNEKHIYSTAYLFFDYILTKKTWYFVPGPIDQLPLGENGAPVLSSEGATQNFTEIWVNTNIFSNPKMNLEKQASILIHELLMGLKILRFESDKTICSIINGNPDDFIKYCSNSDNLRKKPNFILTDLLTNDDYTEIRKTGNYLLENIHTLKYISDIEDLLEKNNFSVSNYPFHNSALLKDFSQEQIIEAIEVSKVTDSMPNYQYKLETFINSSMTDLESLSENSLTWQPSGNCDIQITETKDNNHQFIIKTKNIETKVITKIPLFHGSYLTESWTGEKVYSVEINNKITNVNFYKNNPKSKLGTITKSIELNFSTVPQLHLVSLDAYDSVCTNKDCTTKEVKSNSQFRCSNKKYITIKKDTPSSFERF
jgi:hypothetical protein